MKRRDVLRFALGAPLYAAACATKTEPIPDGELLDPGMSLGHALRDLHARGARPPEPGVPVEEIPILIVGGGVAGLSCAWGLRKRGVADFKLVEVADAIGGTARGGASALTPFPWGAHYITAPMKENTALVELLDEVGALEPRLRDDVDPSPTEECACRAPEERVFFRGSFHEGLYLYDGADSDDLAQLARFRAEIDRLSGLVDARGRRAFALPLVTSSDDADLLALDGLSFAAWLDERGLTSWRLRWFCDYACRDDYGLSLEQTSAWAALFYFCARKRGPASEERPVITWPDGNAHLVRHLARALPSAPLTDAAVVNVVPARDHVDVIVRDATAAHRTIRAKHVVMATPGFVTERVMMSQPVMTSGAPPRVARETSATSPTTSAWAVANLHLRARPQSRGAPLSWDTVFVESKSLGYVTATHQRGADVGPTVLTWYRPLVDDDPAAARKDLSALGRAEWAEAALTDVAIAHPGVRALVERVDVCRWGHAMARPVPGTFAAVFARENARAVSRRNRDGDGARVHLAHTDLSGLALFEEAFFHGKNAADDVVDAVATRE